MITRAEELLKTNPAKKKIQNIDFNEITDEIPDNWQWIQLGKIATIVRGLTFSTSYKDQKEKTTLVLRGGNIDSKTELVNFVDNIYVDTEIVNDEQFIRKNDTLIVASSGTRSSVGKSALITEDYSNVSFGGFMMVVRPNGLFHPKLLSWHIKRYRQKIIADSVGYITNITIPVLANLLIPLPPIEEQARIVARVDELMAEIDEYEKIENQLVELKKNFPGDMKAAVLQAAMQGKLTEQKSAELISKVDREAISDEYDTFDIPDNWQWNTINSVMNVTTGLTFNKLDQRPAGPNTLRVLRGGNILDNFNYGLFDNDVYVTYRDKHIPLMKDDVITPAVTSMEKMCKVGYIEKDLPNTTAGGFVYILRTKDSEVLDPRYMMYFFNSAFNRNNCNVNIHKSGQAFYNLKKSGMVTQPIPLPPIKEQRRIVEKLDQLLPLCEELEKEIA
ncbi:MAG: restriction endonuclease subunit S [Lactobacillus johnsonii]|nr:restriction endonuclease subunit S [Lactobacillus johnsonii]